LVGWWLVASFGERESLTPLPLIPPRVSELSGRQGFQGGELWLSSVALGITLHHAKALS
jgi:hypothetical protein